MLSVINLKCANCGASLEITPEMETFACGYCGASQTVERRGGTIALRLVTDAIKQVQRGTDKTASELAIRRLRDEIENFNISLNQYELKIEEGQQGIIKGFNFVWALLSIGCLFTVIIGQSGLLFLLVTLIWGMGTYFIWLFRAKSVNGWSQKYSDERQYLVNQISDRERQIAHHHEIVRH